jgi:hypothetical protein
MQYELMKWAHVALMGYWIGSDLVLNALTLYVARASGLSPPERRRLWDFLLHVDQHPRNALILSFPTGMSLAAWSGLVPLGATGLAACWVASGAWYWFMWLTHWRREAPEGERLARWDWRSRYVLIAACWVLGSTSIAGLGPFATAWLGWKLVLFGVVMACGIGIRHYIREAYRAWPRIWTGEGSAADEELVRESMVRGTWVLWCLWALVFAISALGALKPT